MRWVESGHLHGFPEQHLSTEVPPHCGCAFRGYALSFPQSTTIQNHENSRNKQFISSKLHAVPWHLWHRFAPFCPAHESSSAQGVHAVSLLTCLSLHSRPGYQMDCLGVAVPVFGSPLLHLIMPQSTRVVTLDVSYSQREAVNFITGVCM